MLTWLNLRQLAIRTIILLIVFCGAYLLVITLPQQLSNLGANKERKNIIQLQAALKDATVRWYEFDQLNTNSSNFELDRKNLITSIGKSVNAQNELLNSGKRPASVPSSLYREHNKLAEHKSQQLKQLMKLDAKVAKIYGYYPENAFNTNDMTILTAQAKSASRGISKISDSLDPKSPGQKAVIDQLSVFRNRAEIIANQANANAPELPSTIALAVNDYKKVKALSLVAEKSNRAFIHAKDLKKKESEILRKYEALLK